MAQILKAVFIIVVELNIYLFIGCASRRIHIFPNHQTILENLLYGFCAYHMMFWLFAFPCSLCDVSLEVLSEIWLVFVSVCMLAVSRFCHDEIMHCYRQIHDFAKEYRHYFVPFLVVLLVVTYFVCINGQSDVDARQYLGEVSTRVDTNRLVGVNVMTGEGTNTIGSRWGLAMLGTNSAVLCTLLQVHPLIICRIVRAALDVILFAIVVLALFCRLYHRDKEAKAHALMATTLSLSILFLFTNTIYTSSAFILYRGYEGKAYCSSVMLPIAIYLSIRLGETADRKYYALIFAEMVACVSISGSAALTAPIILIVLVGSWILLKRKWQQIPLLVFSLLPNALYFWMVYINPSGITLEG